ncbi:hypothetical protein OE88DRAFT_849766 [Heliocybe sulcata]|uniref:Uncharacterized protein n=1 Tax=Heliocybe sulcata TaxID=5364 RepID=A0A5C3MP11_9AGAM|nr:hypothetical protein OE88DRAFT_849766 [Heliocybe sulcata]
MRVAFAASILASFVAPALGYAITTTYTAWAYTAWTCQSFTYKPVWTTTQASVTETVSVPSTYGASALVRPHKGSRRSKIRRRSTVGLLRLLNGLLRRLLRVWLRRIRTMIDGPVWVAVCVLLAEGGNESSVGMKWSVDQVGAVRIESFPYQPSSSGGPAWERN